MSVLNASISYISLSSGNLAVSEHFYKEVLGLEVEYIDKKFLHVRLPGEVLLIIYFKPDHSAAEYTVLNFQIKEIEKVVDSLTRQNVEFLRLDEPLKTDEKGISWDDEGSHLAWFKDPNGHIIALIEN